MTFEAHREKSETIERLEGKLEEWCNSAECAALLGCDPVNVGWPDGEPDGDGETYNVWVEVEVSAEDFDRINKSLNEDYESFTSAFCKFAESVNASCQVLTSGDPYNTVTFELNFFP